MKSKKYIRNLFLNGKHFCVVPWVHLHLTGLGYMTLCCQQIEGPNSKGYGNLNDKTFEDLWQGEVIRDLRKKMINDEIYPLCTRCYEREKMGDYSLRQEFNTKYFLNKSKEYLDWIINTDENGYAYDAKPVSLDLRFSNLCNLKCRTCCYSSSSSWFEDEERLKGISNNSDNAVIGGIQDTDKFLLAMDKYLPDLCYVYFSGGEPLLFKENYYILDKLNSLKKYDVEIIYNTNLTCLNYYDYNIINFWKKFNKLIIYLSLDGNDKRGEYIRKNMIWNKIMENLTILKNECKNANIMIFSTVSVFNILHLPDFQRDIIERGILSADKFMLNILNVPEYYNIKILPQKLKILASEKIEEHIQWLMKHDLKMHHKQNSSFANLIKQWSLCKDYLTNEDWSYQIPKFKDITDKLDCIRAESFADIFPELKFIFKYYEEELNDTSNIGNNINKKN